MDRSKFTVQTESSIFLDKQTLPIYSIEVCPFKPGLPTVIFSGGVHGIERIGSQVLLSYMDMLSSRSPWDSLVQHQLDQLNIIFIPIVKLKIVQSFHETDSHADDLYIHPLFNVVSVFFSHQHYAR